MPRKDEFVGRVALVTGGAGAAIGSTTCRTLASYGAAVVVLDEHERRTMQTAAALRHSHPLAEPIEHDDFNFVWTRCHRPHTGEKVVTCR